MNRFTLLALALAACTTETLDLGHTVTSRGFGATRWATPIGPDEVGNGAVWALAFDHHGDVIAAGDRITKFDGATGALQWETTLETPSAAFTDRGVTYYAQAVQVAVDADGYVHALVDCRGYTRCSVGEIRLDVPRDALVLAKIDSSGHAVDARVIEAGTSLSVRPHLLVHGDRVYATVPFTGTFDAFTSAANVIDVALVAFDLDHAVQWTRAFQGAGTKTINGLTVTPDGDLVVAGPFQIEGGFAKPHLVHTVNGAEYDSWIARFSPSGELRFQQRLELPERMGYTKVPLSTTSSGAVAVGFSTIYDSTIHRPWAGIVADDGALTWTSMPAGDAAPGGMFANNLATRPDGTIVVGGAGGDGYVDLGTGSTPLSSFLAAYDPSGSTGALPVIRTACPYHACSVLDGSLVTGPAGELAYIAYLDSASTAAVDFGDGVRVQPSVNAAAIVLIGAP